MKANIENLKSALNPKNRKGFFKQISIIDPKTGAWVVMAKFYQPGTSVHCDLWISGREFGAGYGVAHGYGLHKPSAALSRAMASAGVELTENIDGRGNQVMEAACLAVAQAVTGKRKFIVHIAQE